MYRQLIVIVALVAVASAFKDKLPEEAKKQLDECTAELGYEMPEMKNPSEMSADDKKKFYCIAKCTGTKSGLISEDGTINADKVKEKMPNIDADKIDAAIEACKDKTGDDECSNVSSKMTCMFHTLFGKKGKE